MSLTINTNLSSLLVQSSLTQSTNGLNQAIERMTTGFKINGAKDNAAGYSIANSMGVKLSSFDVALDNVMLGTTLIDTASSNLSLVTEHLQRMRDLAEQAANGTYGEDSLNAIQSEIDARTDEINRVMSNTEYNGIKIFQRDKQKHVAVEESKRVVNQTTFQSGETYYLSTSEDLVKLQDLVNSGVDTTNVTFELANNIDMQGVNFRGIGTGGGDSGNMDYTKTFKGTFHGNGYSISNVTINTTEDYAGLFGYIDGGVVDSLGIDNCDISGGGHVGGLVGRLEGGNISNSYSTGNVDGSGYYVGGLVGRLEGGNISNSYSTGNVDGSGYYVGGLVGFSDGTISNSYSTGSVVGDSSVGGLVGTSTGTISSSYSTGSVEGSGNHVGGFVGDSRGTISNSYSTGSVEGSGNHVGGFVGYSLGTISNSYSTGSVVGESRVGGLVGYSEGTISNSYSTGSVVGESDVGGLVGQAAASVFNSYSSSSVVGHQAVGGLIGSVLWNPINITNSYSTGSVVGDSKVGGFIGDNISGVTINNGYYDTDASGQSVGVGNGNYNGTLTGVATSEMMVLIQNGTLPKYDYERANSGVKIITSGIEFELQVGIDSSENSRMKFDTAFEFIMDDNITTQAGALNVITSIDMVLDAVNNKQTEFGAVQNRLESVTEALSINIENLTSSMSTIKDADIAKESSNYIKYQILQQASATLLATANQIPSISLQLL